MLLFVCKNNHTKATSVMLHTI